MYADKATNVLMGALDEMATFYMAETHPEQKLIAQAVIDALIDYPRTKDVNTPREVGAYLFTSTARNILKLFCLDYIPEVLAYMEVQKNFESALSLLTEHE